MRQAAAARGLLVPLVFLALTACSSPPSAAPASNAPSPAASSPAPAAGSPAPSAAGLPTPAHVLVVLFENKAAGSVVGSPDAPYLTALSRQGTVFSDAHGVTHPSQPNYLALFSGSAQGVTDDACPQSFSAPTLAGQLLDSGRTFAGYSEDLPSVGYEGCSAGGYARKHDPWSDFPALPASVNQPYSALPADFGQLPTVAFVVPNLCDDMHDCPVRTGDDWARSHLAGYVSWARDHDSLLVVTFDEDDGGSGNRIPTFLVGPMVRAGTSEQRIDHYSMLRTLEDMFGLPPLGKAAAATPITGIWS